MLATAHVVYDRQYFETLYDDWLQYRSVWRRHAIHFSAALLIVGLIMAVSHPSQWLVGAVFAAAGVYETVSAITHRRRWIRERLLLARNDKSIEFEFDDTSIVTTSANGTSTMLVSGFMGFAPAGNGFFMIPDTGISLYVPRSAVAPEDVYDTLVDTLSSAITQATATESSNE